MVVMAGDARYWTPEWKRLRLLVLDRDRWVCRVRDRGCTGGATTVDHVDPVVEGGAFWDPSNLRAACGWCNSQRGRVLGATRQARYRTGEAHYATRTRW
jgi:5-methylcytosine-specific restriction endonuclease McrA